LKSKSQSEKSSTFAYASALSILLGVDNPNS
jgi:hypothetical protein